MTRAAGSFTSKCRGAIKRGACTASSCGESSGGAQDDAATLSGNRGGGYSVSRTDDGTQVRLGLRNILGKDRSRGRRRHRSIYIDVSVPPGLRKTLPIETTRHAFAYVFAARANSANASGPLEVPDTSQSVGRTRSSRGGRKPFARTFDRGDEVMVQAGVTASAFYLSRGSLLQEPVPGTAHRDEHAGGSSGRHSGSWKRARF